MKALTLFLALIASVQVIGQTRQVPVHNGWEYAENWLHCFRNHVDREASATWVAGQVAAGADYYSHPEQNGFILVSSMETDGFSLEELSEEAMIESASFKLVPDREPTLKNGGFQTLMSGNLGNQRVNASRILLPGDQPGTAILILAVVPANSSSPGFVFSSGNAFADSLREGIQIQYANRK